MKKTLLIGLLLIVVLIPSLHMYSQSIVNKLRNDNREIAQLYSEMIAKAMNEEEDTNLNFVSDEIIKKAQFPIIFADLESKPIHARNLSERLTSEGLQKSLASMDQQNDPIPIVYMDRDPNKSIILGYVHYGDSKLIKQLLWLSPLNWIKNLETLISEMDVIESKSSSSSSTSCNSSNAKSFAVDRLNSTIGTTQFLDLHKDNGDSWLFYGSVYSSRYSRDVTVFILIGCSGGSYSVLNVDVQL